MTKLAYRLVSAVLTAALVFAAVKAMSDTAQGRVAITMIVTFVAAMVGFLAAMLDQRAEKMDAAGRALHVAALAFSRYAVLHSEKETEDGDHKAAVNQNLADEMGSALRALKS